VSLILHVDIMMSSSVQVAIWILCRSPWWREVGVVLVAGRMGRDKGINQKKKKKLLCFCICMWFRNVALSCREDRVIHH
jgi:hypothetical protein